MTRSTKHLNCHQQRTPTPSNLARQRRCPDAHYAMLMRLSEAQNWRCCYCHERMDGGIGAWGSATVEHVVPLSEGGADDWSNMAAACRRCNVERGMKSDRFVPIYDEQQTTGAATLGDVLGPILESANA